MFAVRSIAFLAWVAALQPLAQGAAAEFPNRPVRIIVPFPPGGGTDFVARVVSPHLTENLGQNVIVDNRSGAQGVLGVQIGAQAQNDGYTLTYAEAQTVIAPAMMDKAPFNVTKDFTPVGFLIEQPYVMAINASVPASTLAEFIKHVQANPRKLNFGSGAAIAHVSQEVFYAIAKLEMTHIPFRGSAALMTSILSNEIQVTFAGPGSVLPPIRAGRLRALAVTTLKRSPEMPDVPTLSEQGFKGFEVRGWHGLLAPAGTPPAAVARLNQGIDKVLSASPAAKTLRDRGLEPAPASPEEFGRFLKAEEARWTAAVKKYNVKP